MLFNSHYHYCYAVDNESQGNTANKSVPNNALFCNPQLALTSVYYTMYLHFLPKLVGKGFLQCVDQYPSNDCKQDQTYHRYNDHSNAFPTISPWLQQYREDYFYKIHNLIVG